MLGENLTLYFEDRLTMQYQIQEMLRIERIFEAQAIQEELDAYNPLIPDGSNIKATVMVEFADVEERKRALARLVGIENHVWVQVSGYEKVYGVSDEDLERSDANKTAAVHFSRFEFTADMVNGLQQGAALAMGCDHPGYCYTVNVLDDATRTSLLVDLK